MGCPQEHVTYLTTQQNARSCKICPLNINPVEEVSREVAKGLCILRHVSPYLTRKQSEIYYSTIIRPCWSMEARYRLFVVRFKVYLSAAKRHPRYIFFYGLQKKEARDITRLTNLVSRHFIYPWISELTSKNLARNQVSLVLKNEHSWYTINVYLELCKSEYLQQVRKTKANLTNRCRIQKKTTWRPIRPSLFSGLVCKKFVNKTTHSKWLMYKYLGNPGKWYSKYL